MTWILFFKIMSSQEILKIQDGTPLEMSSQEILKIRDATPLEAEDILTYIKNLKTDQFEILKIRDCTSLEAKDNLTYIKKSQNGSIWYFYSKLDVPSNVVQKKRVVRILIFKIRTSQEILKIRDGTPLEAEEILIYKKTLKMDRFDVPSNVVRVTRIRIFKIRSSQEILKIRDGNPLEAKDILTYIKKSQNGSIWYFSSKLDVPSKVVQKKRVVRILIFKIRPSQEILKIRDCTPLEAKDNLTYIKKSQNGSIWYFSSKLDVPSNVVQKKRVVRILIFKIRPSQKFLKIRDGTPLEAEDNLTNIKKSQNRSIWYFSSKLDIPSNVVQKKRVVRILIFKIRPSQEILKIRDGTPLEAEEILIYKKPLKMDRFVAWILFFKIRLSQEILKIRDGTPLEAEEILTYIKNPRNGSIWYFSSKLDVPSNVVQKKRVVRILFFKIRPSQEILKIRDGTPFEGKNYKFQTKVIFVGKDEKTDTVTVKEEEEEEESEFKESAVAVGIKEDIEIGGGVIVEKEEKLETTTTNFTKAADVVVLSDQEFKESVVDVAEVKEGEPIGGGGDVADVKEREPIGGGEDVAEVKEGEPIGGGDVTEVKERSELIGGGVGNKLNWRITEA
ncbi:hypothetical protein OROHE_026801 [Orobanche hederae]